MEKRGFDGVKLERQGLGPCFLFQQPQRAVTQFSQGKGPAQLGRGPHLSLSSLRWSIFRGLRLSARIFFFISRAVCFLPLFWSAWGGERGSRARSQRGTWDKHQSHLKPILQGSECAPYLGQVAAVVGTHGGQSLFLLHVIFSSPLGILLLSSGLLLLWRPHIHTP